MKNAENQTENQNQTTDSPIEEAIIHDVNFADAPPSARPMPSKDVAAALLKKTQSNAAWNKLSPEQRETLEEWLFEDRLSYDQALARAKKELGFAGSRSSLRRFFEHAAQERTVQALIESQARAAAIHASEVNTTELADAGMKVAAQTFLHQITTQPEQPKQWGFLAKLLLRQEADHARTALKREANQIRQQQHELAREKWQDQLNERAKAAATKQAQADLEAREYADDPEGLLEFNRWSNRARYRLFGKYLAQDDLLPESPEEKAALEAAAKLPPGTSQEERQQVAARIFKQVRRRVDKADREAEEQASQEREHHERQRIAAQQAEAKRREAELQQETQRQAEIAACEQKHAEGEKQRKRELKNARIDRLMAAGYPQITLHPNRGGV